MLRIVSKVYVIKSGCRVVTIKDGKMEVHYEF